MAPRALLLDIGNVLLRFDFGPALSWIAERSRLSLAQAGPLAEEIKHPYEEGRIGRGEFLARIREALGYHGTEEEFVAAWVDIFEENLPMTNIVRALHGRLPMYLLSNTNDLHLEWIRRTYPVFALLTEGVYSHEARCAKPGREIFEIAISQFGLDPAATVYVDDLAPNVATAEELGFRCVPYDFARHDLALETMRGHGLPV